MSRTIQLALITVATLCTACGTSYVPTAQPATSSSYNSASNGTTSGTLTTSTPPASTTTTSTGTEALISMRVGAVGYTSTTVTVSAGQVLKMQFTPGIQDQAIAGTGVYPQYSQLGVYLAVNGLTQATQMLQNGLVGGTPQTGDTIDFSSTLGTKCSGSTTCRQSVTITVSHPNNDYWCYNYGEYCAWAQMWSTHPWHGTLTIQTDDTVALTD